MAHVIDRGRCSGCKECVEQCPMEAIKIDPDGKPCIDADLCTDCGTCMDVCPEGAVRGGGSDLVS